MIKSREFIQRIFKECHPIRRSHISSRRNFADHNEKSSKYTPTSKFKLERALIVTKFSRYEYEKARDPLLTSEQLERKLRDRGTDYDLILDLHKQHKDFENRIVSCFERVGCKVRLANRVEFRSTLSKEIMQWADVIVPIGGDGTFLLAAGRASPLFALSQHKTPIVGFNSDPTRSEGRLLLPKQYSENPSDAVVRIKNGDFEWMHRSRIRTTLLGSNGHMPVCTDLYRHTITKLEQEKTEPEFLPEATAKKYNAKMRRIIPYLALNEVFIGEQVSARVSHLHICLNHEPVINKTKCSGLCVSTGTGSTSWHTSINRITKRHVEDLLQILPIAAPDIDAEAIAQQYNQNLLFPLDDPRLCYSIREQICVGVWPNPKSFESRKFIETIYVKSRCIDANLVIDGSISYPFNDGAKVILEINPEDALLTIALD